MPNVKEKMAEVIRSQPDDASYEEIMRELAFERMVARGLEEVRILFMDTIALPTCALRPATSRYWASFMARWISTGICHSRHGEPEIV